MQTPSCIEETQMVQRRPQVLSYNFSSDIKGSTVLRMGFLAPISIEHKSLALHLRRQLPDKAAGVAMGPVAGRESEHP